MRFADVPLFLYKPRVAASFWLFAPLITSLTFGLLGLAAGALASLPKSRFLGKLILAAFVGFMGAYLSLVMDFALTGDGWFYPIRPFVSPPILFALAFVWTLPALWDTRMPGTPLGFLANLPLRLWSRTVVSVMTLLTFALGVNYLPDPWTGNTAQARSVSRSPNIVLIVWDTTRADHFSSYGYSRNTTPHVDQFARRGVVFENAIAASSWTLPATASMFTSLLPHQHGGESQWVLGNGPRTIAEILSSGGYETAGFNGNPYYGLVPWGLSQGFETYVESTSSLGYNFDASRVGGAFIEPLTDEWLQRRRFNQLTAQDLNKEVYRWFERRSDRPYFLFVNYNDAHEPYEVPNPYNQLYGHASGDARSLLRTAPFARFYLPPREQAGVMAAYDGCLNYIDSQVNELLKFLQRSPEWTNTYVIITADHGEGFGNHGTYTHGWDLSRQVLHVPLIIAGPGIPQGLRVTHMAGTRRLFSTVLEMAGMKNAVLHRNSLARMWEPGYKPHNPEQPIVSEVVDAAALPAPQGVISLTTREWQFIYRPGYHRSLLYHWTTDPSEEINLADRPENQALIESLKAMLISNIKNSYRPWRDTRYLLAFSKTDFSPDEEALKPVPQPRGGPFIALGAGASQALFPPDPETPSTNRTVPNQELLKSLPYDGP